MNESEERWQRIERLMEFLLESDARFWARLDATGDRFNATRVHLDVVGDRTDVYSATVERRQVEIERVVGAVESLQVDMRQAVERMQEVAKRIAALPVTISERTGEHDGAASL